MTNKLTATRYGGRKEKMMAELIHKEPWSSDEKEIVYKYYTKLTIKQIAQMLPNRSFCAVKNKVKQIKFGKYKKRKDKSSGRFIKQVD